MVDDHAVELPVRREPAHRAQRRPPGHDRHRRARALGDAGVSITNMAVGQTAGGGTALMLLIDGPSGALARCSAGSAPRPASSTCTASPTPRAARGARAQRGAVPPGDGARADERRRRRRRGRRPPEGALGRHVRARLARPAARGLLRCEDLQELAADRELGVVLRERARARPGRALVSLCRERGRQVRRGRVAPGAVRQPGARGSCRLGRLRRSSASSRPATTCSSLGTVLEWASRRARTPCSTIAAATAASPRTPDRAEAGGESEASLTRTAAVHHNHW